ncbi:MAG: class I adenylate-forming enzyme family protein [Venatoribacter sp.]
MTTNFTELLRPHVEATPDFEVLVFDHEGVAETRTYAQLWENGHKLAYALSKLGLAAGERFGLLMANHPEFVEAMVAASLLGAQFVAIDPRASGDKLAFMLNEAQCQGVITADYARDNLDAIREKLPHLTWVLELGDKLAGELKRYSDIDCEDPHLPWPNSVPDSLRHSPHPWGSMANGSLQGRIHGVSEQAISDVSLANPAMQLIFTSGTTGDPKAIVMTQQRFCGTALIAAQAFGYEKTDVLYSGLSLTHANAQLVTLGAALAHGIKAVFSRRFSRSRLWETCRRYGCTSFSLLGGMTVAVFAQPPSREDTHHQVRRVISAGMPATLWNDFAQRFNVEILEFYGMAEGGLTINPPGGPAGSIGKPAPSFGYRIVNDQGEDVPTGEKGELWFYSKTDVPLSVEYLNNPEASKKTCHDGYLKTGDIVHEDAQGWLYFSHRKGRSIRRNGEFISPTLLERVLVKLPDVDDLYVYGKPVENGVPGEKNIIVAVVPRTPYLRAENIFQACKRELESHYMPDFVQILDEIPKTASEKPQDRFLLELFEQQPERVFAYKTLGAKGEALGA